MQWQCLYRTLSENVWGIMLYSCRLLFTKINESRMKLKLTRELLEYMISKLATTNSQHTVNVILSWPLFAWSFSPLWRWICLSHGGAWMSINKLSNIMKSQRVAIFKIVFMESSSSSLYQLNTHSWLKVLKSLFIISSR